MWILGLETKEKNSKMKQSKNREILKKGSIKFQLSFISSQSKKNFYVIIEKSKVNLSLFLLNTIDAMRYACFYFPIAYT